jgi:Schlafen, AlbA_2
MPIDEKPAAGWDEDDLSELIGRRETPQREFKETLVLGTEGQKKDAEHDVQGLANAGGGFIIYGIREEEQGDGSKVAVELTPLVDGALYEQLNNMLDGRGQPRVPFDIYAIDAAAGGIYIVVEVFARRRPHMANDGTYRLRRNLLVRKMTEAEVAEAYRERFIRERALGEEEGAARPPINELASIEGRVHHGLREAELAMYADENGDLAPPGWLAVYTYPVPLQRNLLDPVRFRERMFYDIPMGDRWRDMEHPLQHFNFVRTLQGFRAQLPPGDATYPHFLYHLWPDGLFEYGTLLESAFRGDPGGRSIPSHAIAQYAHDSLLLFARVYGTVGYEGRIRAVARLDGVAGYPLAIDPRRTLGAAHPIAEETVTAEPWEGTVDELEETGATAVARDLVDRAFLAADAGPPYFFDAAGNYAG